MAEAFVALPAGTPIQVLQAALAGVGAPTPRLTIDGVGAIVELSPQLVAVLDATPGIAAAVAGVIPNLATLPVAAEALPWLEAWNRPFDPAQVALLATRSAQWFTVAPPCTDVASFALVPPPTMTLTGDVAVGIVMVGGPAGGAAEFTASEYVDIALAVIHGFEILTRSAPSSVRLVLLAEQRRVTIPVDPATVPGPLANPQTATPADVEAREAPWRDPALQALGFSSGFAGIGAYRANLVGRPWAVGAPQKSVVILVTKYNTFRTAYAAGGRLVMQLTAAKQYPGPEHLDRVMAHELCHLFEATDEYAGCDPFQMKGPFNVLNGNCVVNPLHVPCLMSGESDDLCGWSRAHVGWAPFP
jgi:hypothetical protein